MLIKHVLLHRVVALFTSQGRPTIDPLTPFMDVTTQMFVSRPRDVTYLCRILHALAEGVSHLYGIYRVCIHSCMLCASQCITVLCKWSPTYILLLFITDSSSMSPSMLAGHASCPCVCRQ